MSNKELFLFNDLQPEADGKPVGVATDKGIKVELDTYYQLIADKGYNSLSPEDTTDFLSKLKEAGEVDKIKRYFISTLGHPYLCRSRGDKEAFTEEEYAYYYYTAVAVRKVNYITHYFANASQKIHEGYLITLIRTKEFEAAAAFAVAAAGLRTKLGEAGYKAIIPSLDEVAEGIGGRYLEYTRRRGNYKVKPDIYLEDIIGVTRSGTESIAAVKTAITSIEDTAAALDAEAYIMPDVKALIADVKEEAAGNRKALTTVLNNFLKNLKKKEVREAFTVNIEAGYPRAILAEVYTYEELGIMRRDYIHNLIDYGNNTYYVLKKVDEYKKARNEEGII